jgi:phosphopantetheine adenylyltransferase
MVSIHAANTMQFFKDLPENITIEEVIIILKTSSKLIDNKSIHPLSERYRSLNIYLNSNKRKLIVIEQLNNHHRKQKFNTVRNQVIDSIRIDASSKKTKKRRIKKKKQKEEKNQEKRNKKKKKTKKKEKLII